MTARISRDFNFLSGVYFQDELFFNFYEVNVQFNVESENISEQNIALDRVKYLFHTLENQIFIFDKNTDSIQKLLDMDMKVCAIPEEPYDQVIAIMLLLKINAITEGRLIAEDIGLNSRMSDGVTCMHSVEENVGPFSFKGWWNDASPKIFNTTNSKSKKVVKLKKAVINWDDLGLSWVKKEELLPTEVVFASFESKTEK